MTLTNYATMSATVRSSTVFTFPVLLWNRGEAISTIAHGLCAKQAYILRIMVFI